MLHTADIVVSCSRAVMVAHKVGRKLAARGDIARRVAVRTLKSWPAQAAFSNRVACWVVTAGEVAGSIKVRED